LFCPLYRPRFITGVFVFSAISNSTREEESSIGGLMLLLEMQENLQKMDFLDLKVLLFVCSLHQKVEISNSRHGMMQHQQQATSAFSVYMLSFFMF